MTLRHLPIRSDLGLLLVGHGTREPRGLEEFRRLAELLAQAATSVAVEICFLELADPSIQQGISELVDRGARRLIVLPLLLFSAGHAQRDIPQAVQAAIRELGRGQLGRRQGSLLQTVCQAPVLACHSDIIELSARRFAEAMSQADTAADITNQTRTTASKTLLLMVGRGSNDAAAKAEFDRFAQLRRERVPVGGLETCFVAMTRPTLDEGLRRAASLPFERVVVQPHLLFSGELLHGIRAAVGAARQRAPERQWIVTEPLGADELLVRALLSRAGLNRVDGSDATEPQAIYVPSASAHSVLIETMF